uniref:GLOBIN domain-containing protein n=1 Tax=Panagrellus redivivus TaxID=6233 RepID=A0A7E4VSD7_PANRE
MGMCESLPASCPSACGKIRPFDDDMKKIRSSDSTSSDSSEALAVYRPFIMSQDLQDLMIKHWETIKTQRPDICHKTMLMSIEASCKLNEIIACGRYCYRDLTKWPKLNQICSAQFKFFERIVYESKLNPELISSEASRLGATHRNYAQYGMKPQFLDLFQRNFLLILAKVKVEDADEKEALMLAWNNLLSFIIGRIYASYVNIPQNAP